MVSKRGTSLTGRERQIAKAVAAGRTNGQIANQIGITERTVKNCLTVIFEKLGVTNRVQLALKVVKGGEAGD